MDRNFCGILDLLSKKYVLRAKFFQCLSLIDQFSLGHRRSNLFLWLFLCSEIGFLTSLSLLREVGEHFNSKHLILMKF